MFTQIYTPVASEGWSVLLAVSPLLLLFVLILSRRVSSPVAFSITLVLTAAMAWILWRMPAGMVLATVLYGVLFALFPLFYVIWSALFLFRVAEDGGYIDRIQEGLQAVGDRMEWKILIVGFGLTAFIDSTAGFLAPVAIATALLSKLGVDREKSAVACLVSSAVPAVFGAAGVAVLLLSQVTGRPLAEVVRSCAGSMIVPAVLAPLLTCVATGGVRSALRFLGPCLAGGLAYTGATLLGALYISPYIAAILGALVFLGVALGMAKGFGGNAAWSWRKFARGWEPFLIMTLCVAVWSLPWVRDLLIRIGDDWPVPALL
ncbi:MAG: L-lactate permease, partial [Alicyclobacillaceae bacterium]|nr:L-lactate permease [Alicyclobacillaceae bacterium]